MIKEESFLAIDCDNELVVVTPLYSLHYLESDDGIVDLGAGQPSFMLIEHENGSLILEHDDALAHLDIFEAL